MKNLSLLFVANALLISCEKKQEETVATETKPATEQVDSASATPTVGTVSSIEAPIATTAPITPVVEKTTAETKVTPGKKPALNPAHGEPFHRCDIAVGAPIDSAPAPKPTPAPQVAQQAPVNSNFNTNPIPAAAPQVLPAPQATPVTQNIGPKPAVNPPHGQPHHRCDIQVGAPLI